MCILPQTLQHMPGIWYGLESEVVSSLTSLKFEV